MWRFTCALLLALVFTGCETKRGEAIVLEKEHIAAHEGDDSAATERETPLDNVEAKERELAPDEIAVDAYVMKAADRGTSRDPRALSNEQWLIRVRVVDDGREFNVHATRAQFEKLNLGDRVRVSYKVGKYTGTVWGSSIN